MEIKKVYPLHDKVLVEPVDLGEQKKGSILIPDLGEEKARVGKVVGVGPGMSSEYGASIVPHVQEGDIVILPKIGAQRVEIQGKEFWLVRDKEIIATVELGEEK